MKYIFSSRLGRKKKKKKKKKIIISKFFNKIIKNKNFKKKNKKLIKRKRTKKKKKKKIIIYNKNKNLNLIHTRDISRMILETFKKAEGIFNLTYLKKTTLQYFYTSISNTIAAKNNCSNNYSSNKFFLKFKKIKILKFQEAIKEFKNGN